MEDKRLFSSAFQASGGTSGGFGRQQAAKQDSSRGHWSHRQHPVSSLEAQLTAGSSQRDFDDPLQDLQRLLNRLITDVEAGELPIKRSQHQKNVQQSNTQQVNLSWGRQNAFPVETELRDGIPKRRNEAATNHARNHRLRRSAVEMDGLGAETTAAAATNNYQLEKRGFTGPGQSSAGNYDHWFAGQKSSPDQIAANQRHSRYRSDFDGQFDADHKAVRRVPPSPSWPLNCQQPPVAREIEITDLRSRRDPLPARPSSSAWWQTLQSSGAAGFGSDASVGGGSRGRAVSNRREATLRASAEQLDHLSRRDGASGSATGVAAVPVAASHRRSASDAAVRGYRTSEDSLDYEETPVVGRGRAGDDDGPWANEAEAGMSLWYRPKVSREQAVAALRDAPSGSFLVRDSQTYSGAYGLALRVSRPPARQSSSAAPMKQDPRDSLVRHFLIEVSPGGGGVRIRGCSNEPVFRSLAELIQCHSLTPLALPCCLRLPKSVKMTTAVQRRPKSSHGAGREHRADEATSGRRGTTYKVLYFCTADVPLAAANNQKHWHHQAVSSAVGQVASPGGPRPIECRMRVNSRGVKLTGLGWHTEFRLTYAAEDCVACELDPAGRRFSDATGTQRESRLFGLIVKKYGFYGDQNACLVLGGNLDVPAKTLVDFVNQTCLQSVSGAGSWTRHRIS